MAQTSTFTPSEKSNYEEAMEFLKINSIPHSMNPEDFKKIPRSKLKIKFTCSCGKDSEKSFTSLIVSPFCTPCTKSNVRLNSTSDTTYQEFLKVCENDKITHFMKPEDFNVPKKNILIKYVCNGCRKNVDKKYQFFLPNTACKGCSVSKSLSGKSRNEYFEDFIKRIGEEGYVMRSDPKEYQNSMTLLNLLCPKGHEYETSINRWDSAEARCKMCDNNSRRLSPETVGNFFKQHNCTWLDTQYIDNKHSLHYECDKCHHKSSVAWSNVHNDTFVFCQNCKKINNKEKIIKEVELMKTSKSETIPETNTEKIEYGEWSGGIVTNNKVYNQYRTVTNSVTDEKWIEVKLQNDLIMLCDSIENLKVANGKCIVGHKTTGKHTYYARVRKNDNYVSFHTLLCPEYEEVDHINHNGLDNRRKNLRDGSNTINARNQRVESFKNQTGMTGVVYEEGPKARYKAIWTSVSGERMSKSFAVGAYGEEAEQLAIKYRDAMQTEENKKINVLLEKYKKIQKECEVHNEKLITSFIDYRRTGKFCTEPLNS